MSDIGMSLNGKALDWVNGARVDGLKLNRTEAKVEAKDLKEIGKTNESVEAELQTRLGDGDVSAEDIEFIGTLNGTAGIQVEDFKAAGFDVTSAQFMFSLVKKAAPTTGQTTAATIHTSEMPKDDAKSVKAFIQEMSGGQTNYNGDPLITRDAMETWLGEQLTEANTAPATEDNPAGGLMYQKLIEKGFDKDGANAICAGFQKGVDSKDHGSSQIGSHVETTMQTKQVLVSRTAPTGDQIKATLKAVSDPAAVNQKFNDNNVGDQNTFATGEAMGGSFGVGLPDSWRTIPEHDPKSAVYDAESATRHNGLINGLQNCTAGITKTYAPIVNGQPKYDVAGFHKALTESFPDAKFTEEQAATFLRISATGVDSNADCAFLNQFARQIPALRQEMDRTLWSAVGGQKATTNNEIDLRVVNCLLAIDKVVTTPLDPVYETQETGVEIKTTVKDDGQIERDFSVAVADTKPKDALEFKNNPGNNFYGGNQRLK
jgi:hypothetical protein